MEADVENAGQRSNLSLQGDQASTGLSACDRHRLRLKRPPTKVHWLQGRCLTPQISCWLFPLILALGTGIRRQNENKWFEWCPLDLLRGTEQIWVWHFTTQRITLSQHLVNILVTFQYFSLLGDYLSPDERHKHTPKAHQSLDTPAPKVHSLLLLLQS